MFPLVPDLQVPGEWNLLSKAVCNLLTNGAMYSPDGAELFLCSGGRGADLFLSGKHRGSPVRRKDSPSV